MTVISSETSNSCWCMMFQISVQMYRHSISLQHLKLKTTLFILPILKTPKVVKPSRDAAAPLAALSPPFAFPQTLNRRPFQLSPSLRRRPD